MATFLQGQSLQFEQRSQMGQLCVQTDNQHSVDAGYQECNASVAVTCKCHSELCTMQASRRAPIS